MTKQEVVKKAYVDLIGEENYNIVKGRIVDGVCHMIEQNVLITPTLMELHLKRNDERVVAWMECTEGYFMPKSIAGIENNNGWIKIESEADLPKETECYHVYSKEEEYLIGTFYPENKRIISYWLQNFTHFQPIQKPEPPIY